MAAHGVRFLASAIWATPDEDGNVYEIIDGDLYVSPIPWMDHQLQLGQLNLHLHNWIDQHDLGCIVVGARTAVVLDAYTCVLPDMIFISHARSHVIAKWGVEGAPDLLVEVLMPWTEERDRGLKLEHYEASGVPHYWIIDPRDETLTGHRWNPAGYIEVLVAQRGERVRAEPFQAIELSVGVLFGEDEEPPRE